MTLISPGRLNDLLIIAAGCTLLLAEPAPAQGVSGSGAASSDGSSSNPAKATKAAKAVNAADATAQPFPAPGDISGPPPVMAVDWSQKTNAWKEYQYALKTRVKALSHLPAGSTIVLDLLYVEKPQQGTSFPNSNQTLDLYAPPGEGPFPLVIYIHGGAWHGGCKEGEGADFAARWLPEKLAVASIDYRFAKDAKYPAIFQDCMDAVAFLRANANKYHLDKKKMAVIGQSAGGHLAAVVAMSEGTNYYAHAGPPLQGAILRCGFYDFTQGTGKFIKVAGDDGYDENRVRKYSPVYMIHPGVPPILIEHGDQDTTAPKAQSEQFAAALQKAGLDVTFTNYPLYNHGLGHPDVLQAELAFLKKCFSSGQ